MIHQLKEIIGPRCSAVNINGDVKEFINVPLKSMRFCEAVVLSFDIPLRVNDQNIHCPGARRSLGFDGDEKKLATLISGNNHFPFDYVLDLLEGTAHLENVHHVNLGLTEKMEDYVQPDLFIAYVQPEQITKILHQLTRSSRQPSIPAYPLLSICGNVFANCSLNQEISISFGCPESRKEGGIKDNEIAIGIPYHTGLELIRNVRYESVEV